METNEKTKKQWTDHRGEVVPDKYVSSYDKQKERIILKVLKNAEKLNKELIDFKAIIFGDCDKLFDLMFVENNTEKKNNHKGNYTLFTFDKQFKIEVNVQDIVDFDDKIQVAQAKINEFIELKTNGADMDLSVLVNNAFKTTKGRLDKARILGLFSLKIKHPLWDAAMDLIKQSITTNNTKRYASVWKRNTDGKYTQIQLNFSAI